MSLGIGCRLGCVFVSGSASESTSASLRDWTTISQNAGSMGSTGTMLMVGMRKLSALPAWPKESVNIQVGGNLDDD
jgi:hypothetical protein